MYDSVAVSVIYPPATIGIVGGGQLGRMLAQVAHRYGYRVAVLTGGDQRTPAGSVADIEITSEFDDPSAIKHFVDSSDLITWELENVALDVADAAAEVGLPVRPGPWVIATAADRAEEKKALTSAGVTVAPYREAADPVELAEAVATFDGPVIIKTTRGGYDGKYQIRASGGLCSESKAQSTPTSRSGTQRRYTSLSKPTSGLQTSEFEEMFNGLGGGRLIVEQEVPFDKEVSVVIARTPDGTVADHGVMENVHVNGILDTTITYAQVSSKVAAEAIRIAGKIATHLDVIGLLCVEMFVVGSELVVNEIAPRPHNSGHCTIEAAKASQFEQHLRAVCGLPLGDGTCRAAAMAQLLGRIWDKGEPKWSQVLADSGISMHLYGKREARQDRKMGHLTCVDTTPTQALERVLEARSRLLV